MQIFHLNGHGIRRGHGNASTKRNRESQADKLEKACLHPLWQLRMYILLDKSPSHLKNSSARLHLSVGIVRHWRHPVFQNLLWHIAGIGNGLVHPYGHYRAWPCCVLESNHSDLKRFHVERFEDVKLTKSFKALVVSTLQCRIGCSFCVGICALIILTGFHCFRFVLVSSVGQTLIEAVSRRSRAGTWFDSPHSY